MNLILSGRYIDGEIKYLFGDIPPIILPLKNKELIYYQLDLFENNAETVLSIPVSFNIPLNLSRYLESLAVTVIKTEEKLTLNEVILYILSSIEPADNKLNILLGDTLYKTIPKFENGLIVSSNYQYYNWDFFSVPGKAKQAITGYFSFNNLALLKELCKKHSSFSDLINQYFIQTTCQVIENKNEWLDLGHYNAYFQSKRNFTTERAFNNLEVKNYSVVKKSTLDKKIIAEIEWYRNVPKDIKIHLPILLDYEINLENGSFYEIEYLQLPTLSELFVFGNQDAVFWKNILLAIEDYLYKALNQGVANTDTFINFYITKQEERLQLIQQLGILDIDTEWYLNGNKLPSIKEINKVLLNAISTTHPISGVTHGDLCFSNILYDSRINFIKVIDPRGFWNSEENSIYGDVNYDVSKLLHSVIGCYDFIIADKYQLDIIGNKINFKVFSNHNQTLFEDLVMQKGNIAGISIKECLPHMICLFLSMIPLHSENKKRQLAFMANALRLYSKFSDLCS